MGLILGDFGQLNDMLAVNPSAVTLFFVLIMIICNFVMLTLLLKSVDVAFQTVRTRREKAGSSRRHNMSTAQSQRCNATKVSQNNECRFAAARQNLSRPPLRAPSGPPQGRREGGEGGAM
jgi:hypothetical protein